MTGPINDSLMSAASVTIWIDRYLTAWRTNAAEDIQNLFTEDGEYHEAPYETDWIGREAIVNGWRSRWDWQQGGWSFDWDLVSVSGDTAVVRGVGRYVELGDFDNEWTIRFRTPELCADFTMVNTERVR